jgi:hypothetical protein
MTVLGFAVAIWQISKVSKRQISPARERSEQQ